MRAVHVVLWSFGCAVALLGCGASEPRESDIFHDPALRAGVVEADGEAERALLARLAQDPEAGAMDVGGSTFTLDAPYAAASGRTCRRVSRGDAARLACETGEGWRFVPDVSGAP